MGSAVIASISGLQALHQLHEWLDFRTVADYSENFHETSEAAAATARVRFQSISPSRN